jgi:hypothetical protein
MSCALSWVAIKGMTPVDVRRELHLTATGTFEEVPESDATGIDVKDWYVIVGCGSYNIPLSETDFAKLSRGCEVVFCNVEEHVMFSTADGWRDGRLVWRVFHESGTALDHLSEYGQFPAEYTAIRDRLNEEQKNDKHPETVDFIFDIPVELARAVTGFRHDITIDDRESPFEVLTPDPALLNAGMHKKKSWFRRLFSR